MVGKYFVLILVEKDLNRKFNLINYFNCFNLGFSLDQFMASIFFSFVNNTSVCS